MLSCISDSPYSESIWISTLNINMYSKIAGAAEPREPWPSESQSIPDVGGGAIISNDCRSREVLVD